MSTVVAASPAPASPWRRFLARHPLTAFFLIAFAGTWLLQSPMVLGRDGLGLLPFEVPFVAFVVLFVLSPFAGPTLGALLVTAAMEGGAGVRRLLRRYGQWRVGLPWYLIALFGYPLIYLVAGSVRLGAAPLYALLDQWPTFFTTYLPALLIFPALITWGEEPGWRGFAQTRMQARYGALRASLVVGLLHGLWHLPIFLMVNGPVAAGPFTLGEFVSNTLVIVFITIIWTWVFNNAGGSILIATLLHASGNATGAWFGTLIPTLPEVTGDLTVALYVVLALVVVVVTRGKLGSATPAPPVAAAPAVA